MTIERANYPHVPTDFPISEINSALSGAQPKLSLVQENGIFYAPGTSPSEVLNAFEVCKDLVTQMVPYCQRKLAQFDGDETATAKAVFQGLLKKNWCTAEQSEWIMSRTLEELGWSVHKSSLRP